MTEVHADVEEVLERIDDGFFALDTDWRFTYLNAKAATLLDVDRAEIVGEVIWDVFGPAVGTTFQRKYERAMESQEQVSFHEFYPPLDSWFEVSAYPSESGLSVYFKDITDRKVSEANVERYRAIVETADEGVYVLDKEGQFEMVNRAYADLVGYDRDDLLGESAAAVLGPDVVPESQFTDPTTAEDSRVVSTETTIERTDGTTVSVEVTSSLLPDGSRFGIVRDVSPRKAYERQLVSLHDVSRDLLRADTAEEVAAVSTTAVHEVLDAPKAWYYRHDPAADVLRPVSASENETADSDLPVVSTDDETLIATAFGSDTPTHVADLHASPRRFALEDVVDVQSCLVAPLPGHGVLAAGAPDPEWFDDRTSQLLDIVATTAATAAERLDRDRRLERQRDRLDALNDIESLVQNIAESTLAMSDRDEIEELVCDRIAESDSYEFAWFGTATDGDVAISSRTGGDDYLDGLHISLEEAPSKHGPTAQAHVTGEMQVVEDVQADPRFEPWAARLDDVEVRASAAIPVAANDEFYGSLNVYSRRPGAFDEEERAALERLGSILGSVFVAVERDRELQRERERLEFMNRLLRHNLLNSLNVVDARLELLDGRVDYEAMGHLETAAKRTTEMIEFVETIREVTRVVGRGEEQDLEPMPLGDVLRDRVASLEQSYPHADVEFASPPDVDVCADGLLGEMLDNVLINAVQHNDAERPRVRIQTTVRGASVDVSVADDGPGVPERQKDVLFDGRSPDFDDTSTGFGLYLVAEIVDSYGGSIAVEDSDLGGALFRLTFRRP